MGLFFQEVTFITEFPDSTFLLPRFLTDGKWDFQVANLVLLISNLEISPMKFCYNTSFTLPKQSQRSRSILSKNQDF